MCGDTVSIQKYLKTEILRKCCKYKLIFCVLEYLDQVFSPPDGANSRPSDDERWRTRGLSLVGGNRWQQMEKFSL